MQGYREELRDSEREKLKLKTRLREDIENQRLGNSLLPSSSLPSSLLTLSSLPFSLLPLSPRNLAESQRDRLMKKLVEVEMDCSSVTRQAEALNLSIKRLQKVRCKDQPLCLAIPLVCDCCTLTHFSFVNFSLSSSSSSSSLLLLLLPSSSFSSLSQDRRFSSIHAMDVNDQKDLLLDRLVEFDTSNKSLRKLLRAQQAHEV